MCSSKKLCKNDCQTCFNLSFATVEKSKYMLNDKLKNPLSSKELSKATNKKIWIQCPNKECNHIFETSPNRISVGKWCPFCVKPSRKLCDDKNCVLCFKKSFASHKFSKYWSKNNKLYPRQVFKGTDVKYLFNCKCGHEISIALCDILAGYWCGYCSNPPKHLCESDKCDKCFNKSFASHEKVKNWDPDNILSPRQVFKYSSKTYKYICDYGHKFSMAPNTVCSGKLCGRCLYKTEEKLFKWLCEFFDVQRQVIFEWCKNQKTNKYYIFDFCIETLKIIIELDGLQHFEQVANWKSPEYTLYNDIFKMKHAKINGYTIIRLLQDDVLNDKIDWKETLKRAIYKREKPKIRYFSLNNCYDKHKEGMKT